jgi:sugar-specific transcriptional regulator TrmB
VNFNENAQTLMHLGLTSSQAKVYLALLRLMAESKVTTIAKFANVPRQDVYRLLAELQQIGIVQKALVKPATFKSAPPEEAVSILLERRKSDFSILKKEADKFVKNVRDPLYEQLALPEGDQFILYSEREAITCKAREVIENINVSLNDITPFSELEPWLSVLSKSIDEALNRGVKIRWITERPKNLRSMPKFLRAYLKYPNFEVRFVSQPLRAKIGIFDSKDVILGVFMETGFARSPALWSNNPSFTAIAENYFETLWGNGQNLKLEKITPIKNA